MNVNRREFSDTLEIAEVLVRLTVDNGGVTVDRRTKHPIVRGSGFIVGGKSPDLTLNAWDRDSVHAHNAHDRAINRVGQWLQSLPLNVQYVGGWLDKGAGVFVFDALDIFDDRDKAIAVARVRGEKAIYDLYEAEVINVNVPNAVVDSQVKSIARHKAELLDALRDARLIEILDQLIPGYADWLNGLSDYNPALDPAIRRGLSNPPSGRAYSVIPGVETNSWDESE